MPSIAQTRPFMHGSLYLLEGHEARSGGASESGASVLARLVGDGELSQVVADHVGLHLNLSEVKTVVHTDNLRTERERTKNEKEK